MFATFVVIWVALLAKVRSETEENRRALVTEFEIHSMQPQWGMDLLTVPIIAAVIAATQRGKSAVADTLAALLIGLTMAIGMAYFPSAVMGGHIRWPFASTHLDTSGYVDLSLTYAVGIVVILLIVNRTAASRRGKLV